MIVTLLGNCFSIQRPSNIHRKWSPFQIMYFIAFPSTCEVCRDLFYSESVFCFSERCLHGFQLFLKSAGMGGPWCLTCIPRSLVELLWSGPGSLQAIRVHRRQQAVLVEARPRSLPPFADGVWWPDSGSKGFGSFL